MVRGFQFTVGLGTAVGLVMKEAVCKGTAQPLVEKHKGEGDLGSLASQSIGVAFAIPLDQTMRLHFAQIIAKLIQAVVPSGEFESGQEGVVDLLGSPSSDRSAAMQQDFHEADHARVVNLDAGKLGGSHRDG